jgi:hypothetical protein
MEITVVRSPQLEISRQLLQLRVIGSGSVIAKPLRDEAYMEIAWLGRDQPIGELHRCFFSAIVIRKLLDAVGESTIGGLY